MPPKSVPTRYRETSAASGGRAGPGSGSGAAAGPGRATVAFGLAAFAAGVGGGLAALLDGAIIGGLSALTISGISGRLAAANLSRNRRDTIGLRRAVRLAVFGAIFPVAASVHTSGLTALLTALLAALLSLLLVPSASEVLSIPKSAAAKTPPPETSDKLLSHPHPANETPDGLDHRGYWQMNGSFGGTGMWGYGFRRAYNPVTGESGEWLGPGLIRKSDDAVVQVDAKGRPLT